MGSQGAINGKISKDLVGKRRIISLMRFVESLIQFMWLGSYFMSIPAYSANVFCEGIGESTISWSSSEQKWNADAEIKAQDTKVTISNIDSKEPLLVGNLGTSKLKISGKNEFLEVTALGRTVLWKYFPESELNKQKTDILIMLKAYDLGGVTTFTTIYKCQSGN